MEKISKAENPYHGGYMHCPRTEDLLPMDKVLHNGFGGYSVWKDGKHYYSGDPWGDWGSFKTLADIESEATKEPNADWRVKLDLPLRDGKWQRHGDREWVLIKSGPGFA